MFMNVLFQDGPLRIEATSTGSNSTIAKIVRMVSALVNFFYCINHTVMSSHLMLDTSRYVSAARGIILPFLCNY